MSRRSACILAETTARARERHRRRRQRYRRQGKCEETAEERRCKPTILATLRRLFGTERWEARPGWLP